MYQRNRKGLTLVELLVLTAIVGLLVAIALPAVQAARESARATTCANNLRQIGIAFQITRDQHKRFPGPDDDPRVISVPWTIEVLPAVEHVPLYDNFLVGSPTDTSPNMYVGQTKLFIFHCPNAADETLQPFTWQPGRYAMNGAVAGKRRIPDGDSQTIAVFEYGGEGAAWVNGPMYHPSIQDPQLSRHNSFLVLLGDGSVRSTSKDIAEEILTSVSTVDGGEVVGDW